MHGLGARCGECPKRQADGWCVVLAVVVAPWRAACRFGAALIAAVKNDSTNSNGHHTKMNGGYHD